MNPLSMLFGAGVAFRNALYDRGVFQARKLSRPVVSIGNISVGGSGKTPFVITLGELLKQRGIGFDVLSRGYGRQSAEIAVVNPGGSAEEFGDEPLLLARKLDAPVIVGADRYQAGLLAERQFSTSLHLLDDGFQHRRLHRDFDIVLLPEEDLAGALLPVGRLREPLSALRRADAIAVFERLQLPVMNAPVWTARRNTTLSQIGGKAVAFCGIARPRRFFSAIRDLGQQTAAEIAFRDHHRYRESDVDRLLRLKSSAAADCFVTTEKDFSNLGALAARLQPLRLAGLHIRLEEPEQALNLVLGTILERSGCRL
jgi:tetraacyldisaccharide 4'-kinase